MDLEGPNKAGLLTLRIVGTITPDMRRTGFPRFNKSLPLRFMFAFSLVQEKESGEKKEKKVCCRSDRGIVPALTSRESMLLETQMDGSEKTGNKGNVVVPGDYEVPR